MISLMLLSMCAEPDQMPVTLCGCLQRCPWKIQQVTVSSILNYTKLILLSIPPRGILVVMVLLPGILFGNLMELEISSNPEISSSLQSLVHPHFLYWKPVSG